MTHLHHHRIRQGIVATLTASPEPSRFWSRGQSPR
jgi:hypothetical protein